MTEKNSKPGEQQQNKRITKQSSNKKNLNKEWGAEDGEQKREEREASLREEEQAAQAEND